MPVNSPTSPDRDPNPNEGREQYVHAEDRQQRILQILDDKGLISIADLSARLTVWEITIRRDLGQLGSDGLLRRAYGGAVRTQSGSFEPPLSLRSRLNVTAKKAIAASIATELADNSTVILDGGTTGVAIAEALIGRSLTVCALNIRVADILVSAPATRVMMPGGMIRHGELLLTGSAAQRTLADYRFDTYVMTVSGSPPQSMLGNAM